MERAVADVGGAKAGPLMALARACASSPIWTPDRIPAASLVHALDLDALEAELTAARDLAVAFPAEGAEPLAHEVAPWAEAASREARLGLAAVALLRALGDAVGDARRGVAEPLLHSAFLVLFLWGDARGRTDRIVYGPRFAVHPAIVPLADGGPGLDVGLALTEDANAIDHLCRIALTAYDQWAKSGTAAGA